MKEENQRLRNEINNIIDDIQSIRNENENIDFAYISIGSKFNNEVVHLKNKQLSTNANYQMIPQFLRNPHEDKYKYVIIIDHFNKEDIKKNTSIVMSDTTLKIRLFIVNFKIDDKNDLLIDFLRSLSSIFSFLKRNQFIVCNYIKFLNQPNKLEQEAEEKVLTIIKSSLEKTNFENCHYEWFGYNSCLYNYIYNKKYFCNLLNYHRNVKKIEELINNHKVNNETQELSKYVFDITEFDSPFDIGPSSLHDILFN